jgi:hypothetical protein
MRRVDEGGREKEGGTGNRGEGVKGSFRRLAKLIVVSQ